MVLNGGSFFLISFFAIDPWLRIVCRRDVCNACCIEENKYAMCDASNECRM